MSKRLFMFPGQGSQAVGMGKDLYDAFPEAKAVFQEIDDALEFKLSDLMFNGPLDELTMTENVQPAMLANSMAMMAVLEKEFQAKESDMCDYMVGHSLGEFSALCAAEAITLADAAKALKLRGKFMQEAVPNGGGIMAIIGLNDIKDVEEACVAGLSKGTAQVANDNCPGQVVISGNIEALELAGEAAKKMGAKRALMLPVTVPVHSALMKPAAMQMKEVLKDMKIVTPKVPIISNNTNQPETDPEIIRKLLLDQMTGRVRFTENIQTAVSLGVDRVWEVGCGKVLSGLVRKIDASLQTAPLGTYDDFEAEVFLKELP